MSLYNIFVLWVSGLCLPELGAVGELSKCCWCGVHCVLLDVGMYCDPGLYMAHAWSIYLTCVTGHLACVNTSGSFMATLYSPTQCMHRVCARVCVCTRACVRVRVYLCGCGGCDCGVWVWWVCMCVGGQACRCVSNSDDDSIRVYPVFLESWRVLSTQGVPVSLITLRWWFMCCYLPVL